MMIWALYCHHSLQDCARTTRVQLLVAVRASKIGCNQGTLAMSRSLLGLLVLASGAISSAMPAHAADYAVHPRHERVASRVLQIDRGPNPYCGPRCGCAIAVQVRHRSLEQAYSSAFDPRTKGDPHYYYGANRTYVRYANPAYPDRVLEY
jgi:hypothetical protein